MHLRVNYENYLRFFDDIYYINYWTTLSLGNILFGTDVNCRISYENWNHVLALKVETKKIYMYAIVELEIFFTATFHRANIIHAKLLGGNIFLKIFRDLEKSSFTNKKTVNGQRLLEKNTSNSPCSNFQKILLVSLNNYVNSDLSQYWMAHFGGFV